MNYNREPDRKIYIQQASHIIAFSYELKRRICIYKNYTVQIQILKINCFIEVIITIIIKRISRAPMYRTRWEHRALCRGVHKITNLEKCPVRISKDEAPTSQEDTVKNLLELTKPLTELNASLNLMAKEIHEGTYRPCWITKIKFLPNIYLRGKKKKDERGRISKEARKLAGQVYTKYKADSLAFVRKEIQATKNAMDRALTVARSFSTKERRKLSIGLSAAKEAEAAKNKEVLGETSYQNRPHPYTRSGGRESSRRGKSTGDDSHRY